MTNVGMGIWKMGRVSPLSNRAVTRPLVAMVTPANVPNRDPFWLMKTGVNAAPNWVKPSATLTVPRSRVIFFDDPAASFMSEAPLAKSTISSLLTLKALGRPSLLKMMPRVVATAYVPPAAYVAVPSGSVGMLVKVPEKTTLKEPLARDEITSVSGTPDGTASAASLFSLVLMAVPPVAKLGSLASMDDSRSASMLASVSRRMVVSSSLVVPSAVEKVYVMPLMVMVSASPGRPGKVNWV